MTTSACEFVLFGPPLAGKSTLIETYAENRSLRCESYPFQPLGQSFSERGYRAVDTDGTILLATSPGAVWTIGTWNDLLRSANRIVVVVDPQESRLESNHEYLSYLGDQRVRIVGLQVTKVDLVGPDRAHAVARELCERFALNIPSTFGTTQDPSSVCTLLDRLRS